MRRKYKRKLLVNNGYQFRQMGIVIVSNILVLLFISALLSWFYLLVMDGSVAYNHNRKIPLYILSGLGIVIFLSAYCSIRRSRTIAGMMKKLQAVLEDAGRGILPERKLVFRKEDYFDELARPLNNCLEKLKKNPLDSRGDVLIQLETISHKLENGKADKTELLGLLNSVTKTIRNSTLMNVN